MGVAWALSGRCVGVVWALSVGVEWALSGRWVGVECGRCVWALGVGVGRGRGR